MEAGKSLSTADKEEIKQQLRTWRDGIDIDVELLLKWSGFLEEMLPGEATYELRHDINERLRTESFAKLAYDWDSNGREVMSYDEITRTILNNFTRIVKRYARQALGLISSKWQNLGATPGVFQAQMENAALALTEETADIIAWGSERLASGIDVSEPMKAVAEDLDEALRDCIRKYRREARLLGNPIDVARREPTSKQPGDDDDFERYPVPAVGADHIDHKENSRARHAGQGDNPLSAHPSRAVWLEARLAERAWNRNDPGRYGGPDPKTIDKILRGESVREDVLEKLAKSLSRKYGAVDLLAIPRA